MEADFSGGAPGWALGQQGYTFAADGTVLAAIREKGQPTSKLMVLIVNQFLLYNCHCY